MIWPLIWYPFALAVRRPRGVFAPLAMGLALALAADFAFAANGVDNFSSATGHVWEVGQYDLIRNGLWVFFVGFVMGVALTDLGERPNDRATFDDALGILALNVVYTIVVGVFIYVPLQLVLGLAVSAARGASLDIAALTAIEIASQAISLIVWAYVSARLSFSGPLTLIRGKIVIFSAWPDTRGRALKIVAANLAGLLMIALIAGLGSVPGYLFSQSNPQPVQSLAAALTPRALAEMFAKEITIMVALVYYAATQAYVYHRLKPKESSSEEAALAAA
jgi:hypothetical protein